MPEQESPPIEDTTEPLDETPGGGRAPLGKIKLLLMVLAVVLVECVIAYLWLPDVTESEARAAAESPDVAESLTSELAEEEEVTQIEVDMGDYSVTAYQPVSSTTLRIDFHLYATVGEEDSEEFLTLKEGNDARLREQVNVIVRGADIADLTDPGLGLIKRRILEKTNRILGKPLLRGVIFSDFFVHRTVAALPENQTAT